MWGGFYAFPIALASAPSVQASAWVPHPISEYDTQYSPK
jgi:hypothetical protein